MNIAGSAGGNIIKGQLFTGSAAQQTDNAFKQFITGGIGQIFLGQMHGVTAGGTTGNDTDLVHRILRGQIFADHGVTCLVKCGQPAFFFHDLAALLFGSCHHFHDRILNVGTGDLLLIAASGKQSGFIE